MKNLKPFTNKIEKLNSFKAFLKDLKQENNEFLTSKQVLIFKTF